MAKQVLIVDDNADNRALLYYALMTRSYDIHQAALGSEAQTLLKNTRFDLALLDIELPDASGLELAAQLRELYPDVVLIVLSANDSISLMETARGLGVNAYAVKPFNLPEVLKFIQDFDSDLIKADSTMKML
ncbi:MAG: response regulator [Chloroflexi bacterium]|jgi:two-component system chemotaxis response regulator CheY|nr:response regulator [Chloroflexota bacterium]